MASNKNTLQQLHDYGQSPWIDFISRELLTSGQLKELIEQGIVGETSNPTIFQQAIGTGDDYDEELRQLAQALKPSSTTPLWHAPSIKTRRKRGRTTRPLSGLVSPWRR